MDRQDWLDARRTGIGGSDIAAVCGISRWKAPMDVYLDKIGASEELEQNDAMYWGTKLEAVVRERFAEEHPEFKVVSEPFLITKHPEHPWAIASVDGWCCEHGSGGRIVLAGWEGKTASAYKKAEWDADTLPVEYLCQVQWSMFVTGWPKWYLSVLIGGQTYREFLVERDDEMIAMLVERASDFWQLVEDRTPPAVDGSEASKQVLDTLYPAADAVLDPPLFLEAHAEEVVSGYLRTKEELKQVEFALRLFENQLKELMGDSAAAVTPDGYEVSWKPQTRTGIDTKRLKEEAPDIAAKYATTTEFRRFGVKVPKGEDE